MIKDAQVRRLRQILGEGHPLSLAALKVGNNIQFFEHARYV